MKKNVLGDNRTECLNMRGVVPAPTQSLLASCLIQPLEQVLQVSLGTWLCQDRLTGAAP